MARWLHALQQFQFSIVHRASKDHGNTDALSGVPSSPCRQCTRPDCSPADVVTESVNQPFDSESTGSLRTRISSPSTLVVDDDLSQPATISIDTFYITTLQKQDHTPIVDYVG